MTQWYYSDYDRNRLGPVSGRDLADLHSNGQLAPDTLVWREGLPQWQPWRMLMAEVLAATAPAAATMPPPVAAAAAAPRIENNQFNPYAVAERTVPTSPYAPPRAALDDDDGYADEGEVVYAGFWKRFAAYAIDSFLLAVVFGIGGAIFGASFGEELFADGGKAFGKMYVIEFLLMGLYFAWMHASANQATVGKMAVGIKVTDNDGQRIGLLRGIGRFFATIPSSLILCIGYVMAGFTDRKRALHDMLASTLVVDRWAYTRHPERQRHDLGTVTIVIVVIGALLGLLYLGAIVAVLGALALGSGG